MKLENYLIVGKNEVKTKVPAKVILNSEIYKIKNFEDSDKVDDEDYEQFTGGSSSIRIPGTFEIQFEDGNQKKFYFPFPINLHKNDSLEVTSTSIKISYEPDEVIFSAYLKADETDISTVDSLYENRVKYLNGEISKHLEEIWKQLKSTTKYNPIHIELLLSLIYVTKTENGKVFTRLSEKQDYSTAIPFTTKMTSHTFNHASSATSYGYTNDAIFQSTLKTNKNYDEVPEGLNVPKRKQQITSIDSKVKEYNVVDNKTDLEKIVGGNYDEL